MDAEEFLKEAAVMKYVTHPNLVCVCGGDPGCIVSRCGPFPFFFELGKGSGTEP